MKIHLFGATIALAMTITAHAALASEPAPALVYEPQTGDEYSEEQIANINAYLADLTPLQGDVKLSSAHATLTIPSTHYYLDRDDAQSVLTDVWGNPPDNEVLGMIFPVGVTPLSVDGWGATVYYNNDGYVSDEDAGKIDYDDLFDDIKSPQDENNQWRSDNGYPPINMIGWAETPSYNAETKKLFWAKEMQFGEETVNTLNYDIRVLGRKGTLIISFISTMKELPDIRQSAPAVLEMAQFDPGSTYADFQPGVDKVAAYGLAGLIGGAVIAKKTGLLAGLLLIGKKLIVFVLAGIAAAFGAVKRFFTRPQQ